MSVRAKPDLVADSNEAVAVRYAVSSSDGAYNGFAVPNLTVTVIEGTPPQKQRDIPDLTVDEDSPSTTIDLLSVFRDADGDPLTFSVVANTSPSVVAAEVVKNPVSGLLSDLRLRYLPDQYGGPVRITVRATDPAELTAEDEFLVTVRPVNDSPLLAASAGLTLDEGATATISSALLRASDVDNVASQLTFSVVAPPTNGLLQKNGTTLAAGNTFTQADINAGIMSYTHDGGETAADQFDVRVSDGAGGTIDTTRFAIAIRPVNDPPTLNAIANPAAIDEDAAAQTVNLAGIAAGGGESQTLGISATSSDTRLIPHPAVTYTSPSDRGELSYKPVADASGTATITLTVRDAGLDGTLGNADDATAVRTFTVTVNPVNDASKAANGTASVVEDSIAGVVIDLGALAADIETGDANLSYAVSAVSPAGAGTLSGNGTSRTFGPAQHFNGTATFTYTVTDRGDPDNCTGGPPSCSAALTSSAGTVMITVTPVNDAPTAANGTANVAEDSTTGVAIDLAALATDIETADGNLTYTIVGGPASGTLTGTGSSRTYVPAQHFNGTVTFTYQVTDRGDPDNCTGGPPSCSAALTSSAGTVTITVTPVNDPPSFARGPDITVINPRGPQTFPNWASDIRRGPPDENEQGVEFLVTVPEAQKSLFVELPRIDASGTLRFTPASDAVGSTTVSPA